MGSDPHAFLGAAINFLRQETAFVFPPGTDDPATHLAQLQLPPAAAAAAAKSGATWDKMGAETPAAAAAAPAAAAVLAAEAAPQEAEAVQEVEMAAAAEEEEQEEEELAAGPSALSELAGRGTRLSAGRCLSMCHACPAATQRGMPPARRWHPSLVLPLLPLPLMSLLVLPIIQLPCPRACLPGCLAAEPNEGNGADLATYSWTQTLAEVVVSVPVPAGTKGRDCAVTIARERLVVGLKGQPPVLGECARGRM